MNVTTRGIKWAWAAAFAVGFFAFLDSTSAQVVTTSSSAANRDVTSVSPQADRLLREMAVYLGSAPRFTFHAELTFDHVLPTGQKLQFAATEDVALERPDKLYVEWNGDLGARQFWYDGTSITFDDPATRFFASESASPHMDDMLEKLLGQFGFSLPLVDFLYGDPHEALKHQIEYGYDLGQNAVNGKRCRALAFVGKEIDWQIWIDLGPQLTPCKLVITYKTQSSQPQFTAVFSDWDFSPRIAKSVFTPQLPVGAERIPFDNVATK